MHTEGFTDTLFKNCKLWKYQNHCHHCLLLISLDFIKVVAFVSGVHVLQRVVERSECWSSFSSEAPAGPRKKRKVVKFSDDMIPTWWLDHR